MPEFGLLAPIGNRMVRKGTEVQILSLPPTFMYKDMQNEGQDIFIQPRGINSLFSTCIAVIMRYSNIYGGVVQLAEQEKSESGI